MNAATFVTPDRPELWDAARRLIDEYARSLGIDLAFQNYDQEIAALEQEYGPPGGGFLLARHENAFVGCGGFHRLSSAVCEMKRLYVVPAGRGHGIGRMLAVRLIDGARTRGYTAIRLDTLPTMSAARHMYAALGFREIPAYRYNPIEGTTFMELAL